MCTRRVNCCLKNSVGLLALILILAGAAHAATFVRGININGPAVTIDGNAWISYSSALASGFSANAPSSFSGTYSFPLNPTPDSATLSVLQSAIYSPQPPNGSGFTMSQTLGNGTYDVYLWMIENHQSNYRDIDVKLEGNLVASGISNLPLGSWQKYGPYTATVTDGVLSIELLRKSKGDPAVYGIAIFSAAPDTQAPGAPANLAVVSKTSGSVTLSWSASTDNVSVSGYEIFRGAAKVGTVSATSFTDTGLSASTSYTYTVKAYDGAGNRSAASNALTVTTNAVSANGPISLHPANGHYFQWRGQPTVLITSAEHYGAVINLDFDYITYLNAMASTGMNNTRTWAGSYCEQPGSFGISSNTLAPQAGRFITPWARSGTPGYSNGGNKFDLNQWDAAYFTRLKDFIAQAGARGIVVELTLFCTFYDDGLWNLSPMKASNNVNGIGTVGREQTHTMSNGNLLPVQDAYVRKIIAELRDFDNVIYEICNEPYFGGVALDWQSHIADVISDAESTFPQKHLITQNINNGSSVISNPNPKVSVFNFHYSHPPNSVAQNYSLNKVIGNNETGFNGSADVTYRTQGWDFIIAGGALYNNLDYSFTPDNENGTATQSAPGGGSPTLRAQLKILKTFMDSLNFIAMAPNNGVIKGGVPSGASARALVEVGKQYGIYLLGGSQANLVVELPAGSYRAEWINTKTGAVDKSEDFSHGGGNRTISSPNYSEDAALRIKLTTAPPPPPPGGGSGTILREVWTGISGNAIANIPLTTAPNQTNQPTSFEAPTDWAENYGTRMRGYVHPPATGNYTFWMASDDNGELWLSTTSAPAQKTKIASIADWTSSREWTKYPSQRSVSIALSAGQKYYIEALQKEGMGGDNLAVAWEGPGITQQVIAGQYLSPWVESTSGTGTGLLGEYFDNADFTALKVSRVDSTVNFDWGTGSPDASVGADTFSVRWTGQAQAQFSEAYTFYTVSDDGVRLWVNGQLIVDNWTDHAPTENSGTLTLAAGQKYDIKMEIYENGGGAAGKFLWSSASTPKTIIPAAQLYPASVSASYTFYRAINLNGNALTIDGNAWEGKTAPNYTFNGNVFENQSITLSPSTDANRAAMIRSSVWNPAGSNVTVGAVPNGSYRVFLYVWEDNFSQTFDIRLEGQVVRAGYSSGAGGHWDKLGPFDVAISDGTINLTCSAGDANLSGIEIWRSTAAATMQLAKSVAALPAAANDSDGDGLVDAYELAVGLNPNLADTNDNGILDGDELSSGGGSTHAQEQLAWLASQPNSAAGAQAFTIAKLSGKVSAASPGKDSVSATLLLPAVQLSAGTVVSLDISGAKAVFSLDKKNRARTPSGSLTAANARNGGGTVFKVSLKNGTFAGAWIDAGVDFSQKSNGTRSVSADLSVNGAAYAADVNVAYSVAMKQKLSFKKTK